MKWLVCRNDRLGDTLLSLPAVLWLRENFPQAEITFLTQKTSLEILANWLAKNNIHALASGETVARGQFDAALLLFYDPVLAGVLKKARIPIRMGPYSKPLSFFHLTSGFFQKRSRGDKNEGEFALELAKRFAMRVTGKQLTETDIDLPAHISIRDEKPSQRARAELEKRGASIERLAVLHPGMGGSALNLSAEQYSNLIHTIREKTRLDLWISIGPAAQDQKLKSELSSLLPELNFLESLPLPVLAGVFSLARVVIGPSTGPLHLAHYLGTPTIGLYSPVRSHKPRRWSPWGGAGTNLIFVPHVECPGKRACLGTRCRHFNCMENLDWGQLVLHALLA
jgi:ADP-heptose:LPS heptosyltransferase